MAWPPLESGDRMTREEFERRYAARPDIKKAELIEGVVYVSSPVRAEGHGIEHAAMMTWLGTYWSHTPGTQLADNSTTRLDNDNVFQPDGFLMIERHCGGQATIDAEGYVIGGPELAGEIAASSVSIDLHQKLQSYRRNGVREYVVWRVFDAALDWFILRGGSYEPLPPGADGIIRSEAFPGLWLDPAALLALNLPRVLEVVHQGLAAAEHVAFVAKLRKPVQAQ
jgi:hypothetical protein